MRVRRAQLEDVSGIAEVHVRTWQAAYEHVFGAERLARIDPAARERMARRVVEGDEFDVFVAEDDDGVAGFVTTGPPEAEAETRRELYAIYVLPRAWGTGAGHALMQAATDAMRERGEPEAILWVLEDNPRARTFYEREGWTVDGQAEMQYLGVTVAVVRYAIRL